MKGCGRLQKVAEGCEELQRVVEDCGGLRRVVEGYGKLAKGCEGLRRVAGNSERLRRVTNPRTILVDPVRILSVFLSTPLVSAHSARSKDLSDNICMLFLIPELESSYHLYPYLLGVVGVRHSVSPTYRHLLWITGFIILQF